MDGEETGGYVPEEESQPKDSFSDLVMERQQLCKSKKVPFYKATSQLIELPTKNSGLFLKKL